MVKLFRFLRAQKGRIKAGSTEKGTTTYRTPGETATSTKPTPPATTTSALSQTPHIFLSYSHVDAAFAATVRRLIEGRGLRLWQDISDMDAGRWWEQIKEILSASTTEHMVLVVSRDALASKVVRDEWRFARREGVQVSPVSVPGRLGKGDFVAMPGWMKAEHFFDIGLAEQGERFLRGLEGPSNQVRAPQMAPEPEADFVLRPEEGERLKALMLNGENAAVGITAALRGAGGYGKTQLARWLAHQEAVEDAFYDGILWVELGEQPKVHDVIEGLIDELTGGKPGLANVTMAAARLKEVIGDRRMLLIIDDVWSKSDLDPFLGDAPNTVRLVTTRFDHVLPHDAAKVPVDAMKPAEAVALLTVGPASLFPPAAVEAARPALLALAKRLGEWPLLLTLANAQLRAELEGGATVAAAIRYTEGVYHREGLDGFDSGDVASRNSAARLSIGASMKRLAAAKGEAARFEELAVFPEDEDIPAAVIARLWHRTAGLDHQAGEALLRTLQKWALLLGYNRGTGTVRLHDVVRKFLRDRAGADGIARQAQALAAAYPGSTAQDLVGSERLYYYRYLPQHLDEAGDRDRLHALLLDPDWLQAKLATTKSPQALVADYEQFGRSQMHNFIGRTLRLTSGICARDQRQLLPQLLGRLIICADPLAPAFLLRTRRRIQPPALLMQRLSLTPPGAETARLEGHTFSVNALAVLPDGRLASGSDDKTIRLWNPMTGAETARLEGHTGSVNALAVLPDGRLASGSDDKTIRLWNPMTGVETACLEGHTSSIEALVVLPDVDGNGVRLASGSADYTIGLWDPQSAVETARLKPKYLKRTDALTVLPDGRLASGGNWDFEIRLWNLRTCAEERPLISDISEIVWVNALAVLPTGRLASGSEDNTIRLWDVGGGVETARLNGHTGSIKALTVLQDGRLASGSHDKTIRLWDSESRVESARLEGHTGSVKALTVLPDGRLVSGSDDRTIRLWDLGGIAETARLEGHTGSINALVVLPDGRLASGSDDQTIRLWDPITGVGTLWYAGNTTVNALAVLPDGRLASGSWMSSWLYDSDRVIRLGDPMARRNPVLFKFSIGGIHCLAALPDGRLASDLWDNTIQLWDPKSGTATARLKGHTKTVRTLTVLPDGRLASGSDDQTIRLWDPKSGVETARLEGHTDEVAALTVLPDGRLVSGSFSNTIHLWDPKSGVETARLEGHTSFVRTLTALPDGRLASGSDDQTIRLWDPNSRKEIARLEVDAPVGSLTTLAGIDGKGWRLVAGDKIGRLHWLEIVD